MRRRMMSFNGFKSDGFFKAITYTGNGGTQSITGVGFQPDLVWIKWRSGGSPAATNHYAYDSTRGVGRVLFPNLDFVENPSSAHLTSFDADGFTLGNDPAANPLGASMIAWCWKAGGTTVTNNEGSVPSEVSANANAGFSIVKCATGLTNNSQTVTIGHGLDSPPELIITKGVEVPYYWWISIDGITGVQDDHITLNFANLKNNIGSSYPFGRATNTVFSLNGAFAVSNIIAYCFHSVLGISKVGSYTGTGASGNNIPLDFEAAFFLVKRTDAVGDWIMIDNARSPVNPRNEILKANLDNAETSNSTLESVNFNSNGIEIVSTGANINASGGSYIYLAIK